MGNRCHDMCSSVVYAHLRIKEKRRGKRKGKITVIASEKFRRKLSVAPSPRFPGRWSQILFFFFPPSSSTAWGKKSLFGCPIFGFRVSSFPTAILLASAVLSISSWHLFLFGGGNGGRWVADAEILFGYLWGEGGKRVAPPESSWTGLTFNGFPTQINKKNISKFHAIREGEG